MVVPLYENDKFQALQKMKKNIKQKVFNPKSVQKHDLLGQIDLHTRQWTEGILTLYSLEVTSQPPGKNNHFSNSIRIENCHFSTLISVKKSIKLGN